MRNTITTAVAASILSSVAFAQYKGEGPALTAPPIKDAGLGTFTAAASPNGLGGADICSIKIIPDPNSSKPGAYYVAATLQNGAFPGQAGGYDLCSWKGDFSDPAKPTFSMHTNTSNQPDNHLGKLNAAGSMFTGNIDWTGKHVVTDTPAGHPIGGGNPIIGNRTNTAVGFDGTAANTKVIAGSAPGYVDAQLLNINGALHYAWIEGASTVACAPITASTGVVDVSKKWIIITDNWQGSAGLHSHSPIRDANGNARAMMYSIRINSSDPAFIPIVDGSVTEARQIFTNTGWTANPAQVGSSGIMEWSYSSGSYAAGPLRADAVMGNGDSVSARAGGALELHVFAGLKKVTTPPSMAFLAIGTSRPAAGIPIPGAIGKLGVNPLVTLSRPIPNHIGSAGWSIKVKPGQVVPNATVPAQCGVLNLAANKVYMGNTFDISTK